MVKKSIESCYNTEKNMEGGLLSGCYCHIGDAFVLGGGTYVRVGVFCPWAFALDPFALMVFVFLTGYIYERNT